MSAQGSTAPCAKVPLLPCHDNSESGRTYPWLFTKGTESSQTIEAQQKLCTPVAGASFVAKIARAGGTRAEKNEPKIKAPNLEEDALDGKKAAKAKAKGKAKAKSSGSKRKNEQLQDTHQESAEALQDDVKFEVTIRGAVHGGVRPRRWIDDLLQALVVANRGKLLQAEFDSSEGRLFSLLVSYGLEFAMVGKICIGKKIFKDWSKARTVVW